MKKIILVLIVLLIAGCINNKQEEKVATPIITPQGNNYTTYQSITIKCDTDGSEIRYTINGETPTKDSNLYSKAITITTATTIKAKAFKNGWKESDEARESYKIYSNIVKLNITWKNNESIDRLTSGAILIGIAEEKNVYKSAIGTFYKIEEIELDKNKMISWEFDNDTILKGGNFQIMAFIDIDKNNKYEAFQDRWLSGQLGQMIQINENNRNFDFEIEY